MLIASAARATSGAHCTLRAVLDEARKKTLLTLISLGLLPLFL